MGANSGNTNHPFVVNAVKSYKVGFGPLGTDASSPPCKLEGEKKNIGGWPCSIQDEIKKKHCVTFRTNVYIRNV